jgi:ParB-like chromosome segregation protein Spo0J
VNLADKIVMCPVSTLVPYASKQSHPYARSIKKLARSLKAFGFTNPILVALRVHDGL